MYLSCTTCALRGPYRDEIEETFRYARAAGYRHWGLGGPFTYLPGLIQWLDLAQLKRRMVEAGLETVTEVWSPQIPTESLDAALVGAEQVAMVAVAAVELGCRTVVQTGGARREGGLTQTICGLERALELTENLPVVIALEPHFRSQILLPEDYAAIFAALPDDRLGITVDVGHFHAAGVDWRALIRRYPEKIFNVHLKDHIGAQSVAIGSGEIELDGLVAVLREIGYAGPIALELEVTDSENLPRYIREAYDYMAPLLS
jgi:sugar phosphate isomerase/epimerase